MNKHWLDKYIVEQKPNRDIIENVFGYDNACLVGEFPEEIIDDVIDYIVEEKQ